MSRGRFVFAAVLLVMMIGSSAAAMFSPAPIRLARLFDRPVWMPDPGVSELPSWHVVERTER